MGVADKLRELRWRAVGHHTAPLPDEFVAPLRGARALEVGGPSAVFRAEGLLPAYAACRAIDGVQFASDTVWHGRQVGTYAPDGEATGTMQVVDGATLAGIADGDYDAVLSSHVIEHIANPLKALAAWRRVTVDEGLILLVAPHMEGTFDHRRPVTSLEHLIEDFARDTDEDDLTHLDETLRLHDRARDAEADDRWESRRRDNLRHRLLHHHVFTTSSLLDLLGHAGIAVDAIEVRHPHDIYVVGRFAGQAGPIDPGLRRDALRASPFRIDRADAARPSASGQAAAR